MDEPVVSILMQELIEVEMAVRGKKAHEFVEKALSEVEGADGDSNGLLNTCVFFSVDIVLRSWRQQHASRVWENLIRVMDEETRQRYACLFCFSEKFPALCSYSYCHLRFYMSVLSSHLRELALHNFANYPLQVFLKSVKSLELVGIVSDVLVLLALWEGFHYG